MGKQSGWRRKIKWKGNQFHMTKTMVTVTVSYLLMGKQSGWKRKIKLKGNQFHMRKPT